jgi:hypothetical protein
MLVISASLVASAAFLAFFAVSGFPLWICAWKSCTGIPCSGCGGTRALVLLISGEWHDALLMNPGAVLGMAVIALLAIYSALVVSFRLSPWRPSWMSAVVCRWILAGGLLANWCYLLWRGQA